MTNLQMRLKLFSKVSISNGARSWRLSGPALGRQSPPWRRSWSSPRGKPFWGWIRPCEATRILCISRGLSQANVELAEERGLKPVFSFIVERTASLMQKWPILEPKIMSILRTRLWLALELLRRGEHLTGNSNPITVVDHAIEEESDLDLISLRHRIVKLLEGSDCAYVSVEIGQGRMNTGPEKNTRIWAQHASTLPALPGTIIAPWDPSKSTGIF